MNSRARSIRYSLLLAATSAFTIMAGASATRADVTVPPCTPWADNSGTLQAALNSLIGTGGSVFASGQCPIATGLVIPESVTLEGNGAGSVFGYVFPTRLTWTGGPTGDMISTPNAAANGMGIKNLALNGNVAYNDLATSGLRAISIKGSTFSYRIDGITIQNVGSGMELVPGYSVIPGALIEWGDVRNVQMLYVGIGMDFAPNTAIGMQAGGVTNNSFSNVVMYQYVNYGIRFHGLSDNNRFNGGYITTNVVGSTGIAVNTLDPANPVGTYSNSFTNFEIECNSAGSGAGINSIVVNNTQSFSTYFQGALYGCPAPQVNYGGQIEIKDDANQNFTSTAWKSTDAFTGQSLQNTSWGPSAAVGIQFGNAANSGLVNFIVNGPNNNTWGGPHSVNLVSLSAAPFTAWINGAPRFQATNAGVVLNGTIQASNAMGNSAGTNLLCYSTGSGMVTYCNGSASDASLKRDFTPFEDALGLLDSVSGGYYFWKDEVRGAGRQIGVIADEAEKALPELVSKGDDGLRSFDYPRFSAVLLQAIKELEVKVNALEKRN